MKLTCDGLALSDAILKVSKAMPIKKNNNLLEGIKLVAKDGFLTLTATDLELAIVKRIAANVQIEGEVLVVGRFFADFVKSISAEEISLECSDGKNIVIQYGANEGNIKCMETDEYPRVDQIEERSSIVLAKDQLKDVIAKTVFCASNEDSRPILKGCLFEVKNNHLNVVSLDGYRLAFCHKDCVSTGDGNFIIPARSLGEVMRLADEADQDIKLVFSAEKMMVVINNTQIISRLIMGDYINYRGIINIDFNTTAVFARDKLFDSMGRVNVISRADKNNNVRFELNEDVIWVDSRSEIGNVHESIPAEITGKDCVICFNCKFIQDVINVVDDEFIKMNVKNSNSPCVFTPVEGDEYLFLVLPMRVQA